MHTRPKNILFYRITASLLLLCLFLQLFFAAERHSPVIDEISHITAGYHYTQTLDFEVNRQHPPLIKVLSGVMLKLFYSEAKLPENKSSELNEWQYGLKFLYSNNLNKILRYSRLPTILLTLLLGLYVFCFTKDLWGWPAAILALTTFSFMPEILAHGHFVTMDLAVTTFLFISIYYYRKYFLQDDRLLLPFLLGTISLGVALGSKFSAIAFLPLPLLLILIKIRVGNIGNKQQTTIYLLGIFLAVIPLIVSSLYFFQHGIRYYFESAAQIYFDFQDNFHYYLAGKFQKHRYPHYFAYAYLIKTPLSFLILLALSVFLTAKRKSSKNLLEIFLFLIFPTLIVFVTAGVFAKNIGLRYVLAATPFLIVLAAGVLNEFSLKKLILTSLLCSWQIASTLSSFPHQLGYFNELIGGSKNGYQYLDDSNLDWGQDLKELKEYLIIHRIPSFKLMYAWLGFPQYYNIRFQVMGEDDWLKSPSQGYYIISTQALIRGVLFKESGIGNTDWLYKYKPIDRIGNSFFVYKF